MRIFRFEHSYGDCYASDRWHHTHGPQNKQDCRVPGPRFGFVLSSPWSDLQSHLSKAAPEPRYPGYNASREEEAAYEKALTEWSRQNFLRIKPKQVVGVLAHQFDGWWDDDRSHDFYSEFGWRVVEFDAKPAQIGHNQVIFTRHEEDIVRYHTNDSFTRLG